LDSQSFSIYNSLLHNTVNQKHHFIIGIIIIIFSTIIWKTTTKNIHTPLILLLRSTLFFLRETVLILKIIFSISYYPFSKLRNNRTSTLCACVCPIQSMLDEKQQLLSSSLFSSFHSAAVVKIYQKYICTLLLTSRLQYIYVLSYLYFLLCIPSKKTTVHNLGDTWMMMNQYFNILLKHFLEGFFFRWKTIIYISSDPAGSRLFDENKPSNLLFLIIGGI
jgi:hypothetical protein